jgi:SAM-dependent methyltransferase
MLQQQIPHPPQPATILQKTIERDCPLCGRDNHNSTALSYAPKEWPMKKCSGCGMVYLEKAWSLDILYEEFSWEKSVEVEDKRREELRGLERKLSKRFRKLRNALLPRKNAAKLIMLHADEGNILDVGSGSGHYLLQLSQSYVPYGIEISSNLVQEGLPVIKERGGDLVNKDALGGMETFDNNFFSGIIMRSFLEHDCRPKEILQQAQRILQHGGIAIIKVPNYACLNRFVMGSKWCGFRFPEHVNYFTPESLIKLVSETGLYVKAFSFMDRLPISDNMWLIARKDS